VTRLAMIVPSAHMVAVTRMMTTPTAEIWPSRH
jgi:hypothetical protein